MKSAGKVHLGFGYLLDCFDRKVEPEGYGGEKRGQGRLEGDSVSVDDEETVNEELAVDLEEDEGGTESFFAWFFRGAGPSGVLSGGAFQKNRLAATSSAYATIFEDDHLDMLFGRHADVMQRLAKETALDPTVPQ